MRVAVRFGLLCALLAPARSTAAQDALPLKHRPAPTTPAITTEDLMTRLYVYADDSMMGRQTGTEWNLKATAYIESQVRRMGLTPGGDSGTFFQNVPLVRTALDTTSTIATDGDTLRLFADFVPRRLQGVPRSIDGAAAVYAGVWGSPDFLPGDQAAGKLVILRGPPGPGVRLSFMELAAHFQGAAGLALPALDNASPQMLQFLRRPSVTLAAQTDTTVVPALLLLTSDAAARLLGVSLDSAPVGKVGKTIHGRVAYVTGPAPGRNVVAILPGRDRRLAGEYVAIGAHNDHIGFTTTPRDHDSVRAFNTELRRLALASANGRVSPEQRAAIHVNVDSLHRLRPARLDSIYNGADDDGSGTVTVLEIAEQLAAARQKPKRSVVFVWHTGEELGLFGSEWFTDHPTVPRDSIVAQLNMDMVGRGRAGEENLGGPTYLQLIGSRRLSTELGDLVETVNKTEPQPFTFDYQYDAAGHPEQYYCRSDHYMYARYGIPIVFFSTGDHQDYHQLTDEPQYIDYDHMARVGRLVYDIALAVANLDHRVVVDKPKPDLNAPCRQ